MESDLTSAPPGLDDVEPTVVRPLVRIVDDHAPIRAAVDDLLTSVGFESVSYASARDFLRDDPVERPGCLILDVRMPELGGFDLQAALGRRGIRLPIIFVTGHGDIRMSVRALKAGAVDFLAKPFDDQMLIDAVNAAILEDIEHRRTRNRVAAVLARADLLAPGERLVMDMVVQGHTNREISTALNVAEITVKVRRATVMRKMQAETLPDLVRMSDELREAAV